MPVCAAAFVAITLGCASEQRATRSNVSPIEAGVGSTMDGPATLGTAGSTGGTSGGAGGAKPAPGSGGTSGARIIEASAPHMDADAEKPIGSLDCNELHAAWIAFAESHDSCSVDADCETYQVYRYYFTCDGPPGLAHAFTKGASALAAPYEARYFELECGGDEFGIRGPGAWTDIGFDGLPVDRVGCSDGTCRQMGDDCFPGDGGFPDGGTP